MLWEPEIIPLHIFNPNPGLIYNCEKGIYSVTLLEE